MNECIKGIEVETIQHCNWKCDFCPVKTMPKSKATMPLELHREILEKCKERQVVLDFVNGARSADSDFICRKCTIMAASMRRKLYEETS